MGKAGLRREICAVRVRGTTMSAPAQQLWDQLLGDSVARNSKKRR